MDTLNPKATAVLIIDVQRGLFLGHPAPDEAAEVVSRINEVVRKARSAGVPIIYVQHHGVGEGNNLVEGAPEWQLHPNLSVEDADLRIGKTTCDVFYRTGLLELLRGLGVQNLVVAGYATDFCVDTSVRNAVSHDFQVVVAADAHTTNDGGGLTAAQIRRHHNYSWSECIARLPVRVIPAAQIEFVRNEPSSSSP